MAKWLLAALLAAELSLLAWHRDIYLNGWDLLGFADAAWGIHHDGLLHTIARYYAQMNRFQYWDSTNSFVFPLVAGGLDVLLPWQGWATVVVLVLCSAAAALCVRTLRLPPAAFLCAVLASPVLLCFALVGFPFFSCIIPYALALSIIYGNLRAAPEALAWLILYQLGFCCYEIGRTAALVPIFAALTLSGFSVRRRVAYLGIGLAYAYGYFVHNLSTGPHRLMNLWEKFLASAPAWSRYWEGVWTTMQIDIPLLLIAGAFSVVLIRRDRWFWRLLWLAQLGIVAMLTVNGEVLARRYLLLDFVSVLLVVWTWAKATECERIPIGAVVLMGMICTAVATMRFAAHPLADRSLPYTYSPMDYKINVPLIDEARAIVEQLRFDPTPHIFLYDYDVYTENTTDPQAFPERLMVALGPKRFEEKVFFVGKQRCRYSCLPFVAPEGLPALKERLGTYYLHAYDNGFHTTMVSDAK